MHIFIYKLHGIFSYVQTENLYYLYIYAYIHIQIYAKTFIRKIFIQIYAQIYEYIHISINVYMYSYDFALGKLSYDFAAGIFLQLYPLLDGKFILLEKLSMAINSGMENLFFSLLEKIILVKFILLTKLSYGKFSYKKLSLLENSKRKILFRHIAI